MSRNFYPLKCFSLILIFNMLFSLTYFLQIFTNFQGAPFIDRNGADVQADLTALLVQYSLSTCQLQPGFPYLFSQNPFAGGG